MGEVEQRELRLTERKNMFQDIKLETTSTVQFSIICPQCASRIILNQAAFESAISREVVFKCPDCKNEFYFELHCLTRAAELPLEPSTQHSEAGDAPTLSGLYNCQLCGLEKCSQPGICQDCLSEPSKAETDQWSAANPASS